MFTGRVSLISSYMWQFLVFPDCSWPSHYLKITAQVFCRIFLYFGLSDVSALLAWGCDIWGRSKEVKFPSRHLHLSTYSTSLLVSLVKCTLIARWKRVVPGFPTVIISFPFLYSIGWVTNFKLLCLDYCNNLSTVLLRERCFPFTPHHINKTNVIILVL